jgi:hypothetical protein
MFDPVNPITLKSSLINKREATICGYNEARHKKMGDSTMADSETLTFMGGL